MDLYLQEIQKIIKQNFQFIRNWNNEIQVIDSMDTTFLITKKNFVIIGINSVNEFLLESIISLYYKKYFDLLLKETGFETYIKHELLKVERVIMENHDGTYRGFSSMIGQLIGNIIGIGRIEKFIEHDFKGNISLFKEKLNEINKFRNSLGHSSEYYFRNNGKINFDINKIEEYILILENGLIDLSTSYYNSMDELLDFRYSTLTKFPDVSK